MKRLLSLAAGLIAFGLAAPLYAADMPPAGNPHENHPSTQDQAFINQAWNINTTEIKLGQIAQTRATNQDVRGFAQMMITDHSKLNTELQTLAAQVSGTVPLQLEKTNQDLIDRLTKLSGSDFDKQYMGAMIDGHASAIGTFEERSKETPQTDVDKWAAKTLPSLKEHLTVAEKTGKEVGAPSSGSAATPEKPNNGSAAPGAGHS
jgi:putative membrane protein